MSDRLRAKIKWQLLEYECDNCKTGLVQIHLQNNLRKMECTTTISGCLDCGKHFGIMQAKGLKPFIQN